ncbi:C40 family peptidase, partial [Lentzea aerocolonigenes]|uniref:C40 family peptidase n=1 Tax=Lentzea aerocolonigenes TaxID=68170 RepID=UPI000B2B2C29
MTTTLSRRGLARLVLAAAFTVVASAGAVALPVAAQASDLDGPITRSEVIQRAQYWVDHQPGPYDQGGWSPGPGDGHMYRRDCSGYVSMALHLKDVPATASFANWGNAISRTDLKAGDFMLYPGTHMFLFDRWDDANGNFWYYSFGSTPVRHLRTNINNASLDGHPNGSYRAYRYKKIVDDAPPPAAAGDTGGRTTWHAVGNTTQAFARGT